MSARTGTEGDEPSSTVEIAVLRQTQRWVLEVQDDAGARRLPLSEQRAVIGSSSGCDIRVSDPTVSARHCAVAIDAEGVSIEDLGSTNGTFVGNARVMHACAGLGAVITIGHTTVVLTTFGRGEDGEPSGEPLAGIAGGSLAMRRLASQVRRFAQLSSPVLIAGESGTGKELIARALHQEGPRAGKSFVPINVAALPRELVESEMFGHERGAFTGAVARRMGAFAEAEGGTLFLDEIGELPLEAQPKLLRALDGYEVRRVGAAGSSHCANARLVAATHVPLAKRVAEGRFRRDLFHRLEVFVVEIPPLRARPGDIAPIAHEMLARGAAEIGPRALSSRALARLIAYDWPGNVRELRNVLWRAADGARGRRTIDATDVDRALRGREPEASVELTPGLAKSLLREHKNNLSAAARAAGYPRTSFRKIVNS